MRAAHRAYLAIRSRPHVTVVLVQAALTTFRQARSTYRRICRSKRTAWSVIQESARIDQFFQNPKRFWNDWHTRVSSVQLEDIDAWTVHFRSVLDPELPPLAPLPPDVAQMKQSCLDAQLDQLRRDRDNYDDFLDGVNRDLNHHDVADSVLALRANAAADSHGLTAEALRACWMAWIVETPEPLPGPYIPAHLIFRSCLQSILQRMWFEPWPDVLCCSKLVPVPKGPPSLDPNRYRGIAVSSIFTKLHEHIMFERADSQSEHYGMRVPTQCGFRKRHGTLDAIFTLNHLITKARHTNRRLCVIFVDFEKAFDLVPRSELVARAQRLGFHGRFLDALGRIYDRVLYKLRIGATDGQPIPSTTGTKQGSHLSPLMFGWFIEQLHFLILSHTPEDPDTTIGDYRIPELLYADDSALIAGISTATGVDPAIAQRYLDLLSSFCSMFGMRVNVLKTKFMEFYRGGQAPTPDLSLTYRGTLIPRVASTCYMGVVWTSHQSLHISHRSVIYDKGLRALYGMLARCKVLGIHRPDTKSRLFKVLVRTAFSHACQIWGVAGFKDSIEASDLLGTKITNPGECIQLLFLRMLAGVGRSAHRLQLLHEFGHHPIIHYFLKLAARFWNATISAPTSSLTRQTLLADVDLAHSGCRTCWSHYFLSAIRSLGLCPLPIVTSITCHALHIPIPGLVTLLQQRAHGYFSAAFIPRCPRVCDSHEVLVHTYRYWIGMVVGDSAPHCAITIPAEARFALIRLRLSCTALAVNHGRFRGIPRLERTCPVCVALPSFALAHPHFPVGPAIPCEDIRHFLLECPLYDVIRRDPTFSPIFSQIPPIGPLPAPSNCLRAIFTAPHQALLARCVHRMFQLRSSILSNEAAWGTPHSWLPPPGHAFNTSWFP